MINREVIKFSFLTSDKLQRRVKNSLEYSELREKWKKETGLQREIGKIQSNMDRLNFIKAKKVQEGGGVSVILKEEYGELHLNTSLSAILTYYKDHPHIKHWHRLYICNLKEVDSIFRNGSDYFLHFKDGKKIPISRGKFKEEVKEKYKHLVRKENDKN